MEYKYDFLLDKEKIDLNGLKNGKVFTLSNKYSLKIKININKTLIELIFIVLDIKNNEVHYEQIKVFNNDIKCICRRYIISIPEFSDILIIKIFNKNLLEQLDNSFNEEEIKNEIQYTNFTNYFEFIDLSILMIMHGLYNGQETKDLFKLKSIYYGHKSFEEIIENYEELSKDAKTFIALNRLSRKQYTDIQNLSELFSNYAMIYINCNTKKQYALNKIENYANSMENERIDALKPYFIL